MAEKTEKTYVIVRGSVKTPDGIIGVGKPITLEESEAMKMDPQGTAFMPKEKWDAQQRAAAASKAELEKVTPAPAAKAEKGGK